MQQSGSAIAGRVKPVKMRLSEVHPCCVASKPGGCEDAVFRRAGHAILDPRHGYDNVAHAIIPLPHLHRLAMTTPTTVPQPSHYVMSMVIIGVLFVKVGFDVDNVGAFLIPMAFYLSYFFLALPSAVVLKRTGMKKGMALGLLVMAIGSVLFAFFMGGYSYVGALVALF